MQKRRFQNEKVLNSIVMMFDRAENYWEKEFNLLPKCCSEARSTLETCDETEEEKAKRVAREREGFEKIKKMASKKNTIKSKLTGKELEEYTVNKVEGKRREEDTTVKKKNKIKIAIEESNIDIWSKEEDKMLIRLCHSKLKAKWKKISEIIGSKSASQCAYRYKKLKAQNLMNKPSEEDEDILISDDHVKKYFSKYENYGVDKYRSLSARNSNLRSNFRDDLKENSKIHNNIQSTFTQTKEKSVNPRRKHRQNSTIDTKNSDDFLKIFKPSFHDDEFLDFPEFYDNGGMFPSHNNSNKKENEFDIENLDFNAKIMKKGNTQENNSEDAKRKNDSTGFGFIMQKNSSDVFTTREDTQNKMSTAEFKQEFEKNFLNKSENEDLLLRESDFKMTGGLNHLNNSMRITENRNNSILSNLENFFKNTKLNNNTSHIELNTNYLKLTKFLVEVSQITNDVNSNKEQVAKALEYQALILSNMISITQQKINET